MLYELRINIFVEYNSQLDDVQDKLDDLRPLMKVVNPGQLNQECSVIDLIENYHDESPHGNCIQLSHWDNCPL